MRRRKFGAPKSELAKEPKVPVMRPAMPYRKEAIDKVLDKMIANAKDPEEAAALTLWKAQIAAREVPGKVDDQFGEDFRCWLLGRGTKTEHAATRWGRANVAMWNGEVAKYVDGLMNKRLQYATDMVKLSMRQPRTLDEYYLYYKFIVKGKIKLESDKSTGLSYYDFSDDSYLDEWERMSKVFDREPQPMSGYTQKQLERVECDGPTAPAPGSSAKAEEQQVEETVEKAEKADAPSINPEPPVSGMKKEKEEEVTGDKEPFEVIMQDARVAPVKVKKEPKEDKRRKRTKQGDSEPLPEKQATVKAKELPSKPEKSDVAKAVEETARILAEERDRKPKRKADDGNVKAKRIKEGEQPMDVGGDAPPPPLMPIRMPTLPDRAPEPKPEVPFFQAVSEDASNLWNELRANMDRENALPKLEGMPPVSQGHLPRHGPARMTTALIGNMDLSRTKDIVPYVVDDSEFAPMDTDEDNAFRHDGHEETAAPDATYDYPAEPETVHPAAEAFTSPEGRAGLHNAHTPAHHKDMLDHMEGVVNALKSVTDQASLGQLVRAADKLKQTRADMMKSDLSDSINQKVYDKLVDDIKVARKETMRALIRMLKKAKEGNNDQMVRHLNDIRKRIQSQSRGLLAGLDKRAREVWNVKTRMQGVPTGVKGEAKAREQARARRDRLAELRKKMRGLDTGEAAYEDWKQEFHALSQILYAGRARGENTQEVEHDLAVLNNRIQQLFADDRYPAQQLMDELIDSGVFTHVRWDFEKNAFIM